MNKTDGRNPHATLPAAKADSDGACGTRVGTDGNGMSGANGPKSDSVRGNQDKGSNDAKRF